MHVAEVKTSSTANKTIQKKRQPFFSKEGESGFFSKLGENTNSFFSPATIQPMLTIGQPNDKYEVEADTMADKVVRRKPIFESDRELPGDEVQTKPIGIPSLQTQCTECEEEEKLQRKEDGAIEKDLELQAKSSPTPNPEPPDDEENIQAKSEILQNANPDLENRLSSSKGGGSTLSPELQTSMGSAFGTDFNGIRVHTDSNAVQMNKGLNARAFTHGKDIYFNEGKYDINGSGGKHLLAHELTHMVQQGATQFEPKQDEEVIIEGTSDNTEDKLLGNEVSDPAIDENTQDRPQEAQESENHENNEEKKIEKETETELEAEASTDDLESAETFEAQKEVLEEESIESTEGTETITGEAAEADAEAAPIEGNLARDKNPDIEAWQAQVNSATNNIEAPSLGNAEDVGNAARAEGEQVVAQRRGRRPYYSSEIRNRVPEPPEAEPQPLFEPEEEPLINQELQNVDIASNRLLPDQTMPTLVPTPRGTVPRLGDSIQQVRQEEAERQAALQELQEAGETDANPTEGEQQVEALREQQGESLDAENAEAEAEPVVLQDEPQRQTPLPGQLRQSISSVIARLMADLGGEAERMLGGIRSSNYGGKLELEYPEIGNEFLPTLRETLETRLRLVAEQAGIANEDLEAKIEERRTELAEEQAAHQESVEGAATENTSDLQEEGQDELNEIATTRGAMNRQAEQELEAANGSENPEVIRAKRDRVIGRINQVTGQQNVAYEQAKIRREQQLGQAQQQQVSAYRAAVERDVQAIRNEPDETLSVSQKSLMESTSRFWGAARENTLRETFRVLNAQNRTAAEAYKKNLGEVAEEARTTIRNWANEKLGETTSWWESLYQQYQDWRAQAAAETQAWEVEKAGETRDQLVGDFAILTQMQARYGDTIDRETFDNIQGLSDAQKAVLEAYYFGEGERGNSIAAVAEGLRVRVADQHREEILTAFKTELETRPAKEWEKLANVAQGENSAFDPFKISQDLRHAMFGGLTGWGTDEDLIFSSLGGLSPLEGIIVRKCYSSTYHGANLDSDLRSELSGAEHTRASAQLSGNEILADAAALREAMDGWGTDEDTVMQTLRGKPEEERRRLIEVYRNQYGVDLNTELDDEMSGLELERADALMDGDVARADALGIEYAMDGAGTDEAAIEATYQNIRQDVEAQASREGWNTRQMEEEIARRNLQVEASYNTRFGNNWQPGDESTLRQAFQEELSGSELDLANALGDNDLIRADAARIAVEADGVFSTSDNVVNGVLRNQYERSLEEIRRDEWPAMQEDLDRRAREENWDQYKYREEERKLERELEERARGRASVYMGQLEDSYDERYTRWGTTGGLRTVIERNMGGSDQEMARSLLTQGSLTPVQELNYAVSGAGTNEDRITETLAGRSEEEINQIRAEWNALHPDETLDERLSSELGGRDAFDTQMLLQGEPENAEQELAQMQERTDWEVDSSWGLVGNEERAIMLERMNAMQESYDTINNPNASERDREIAMDRFHQRSGNVSTAVEGYRRQVDAVTDSLTSVVAISAAVVTAIAITILTGGTAGPVMVALAASLAGTVSQIATKAILKGSAYSMEDFGVDLAIGAVDALASIATAGIGGRLLSAARGGTLFRMAQSPKLFTRIAAHAIAEGAEGFVSTIPSALTGNLLNDKNWEQGNPFSNIAMGTLVETGIGTVAGAGFGSIGAFRRPNLSSSVLGDLADVDPQIARNIDPSFRARPGADVDLPTTRSARGGGFDVDPMSGPVVRNTDGGDMVAPRGMLAEAPPAMRENLPKDLKRNLPIHVDPDLPSNSVRVHYDVDADGLIKNVHMRIGPTASAADVNLHVGTVRTMQQYRGLSGRLQNLQRRMLKFVGAHGEPRPGTAAFEAKLELDKLHSILGSRAARMADGDINSREMADTIDEIHFLSDQMAVHRGRLNEFELTPGRGFVAAEGKVKSAAEHLEEINPNLIDKTIKRGGILPDGIKSKEDFLSRYTLMRRADGSLDIKRENGSGNDPLLEFSFPDGKKGDFSAATFKVKESTKSDWPSSKARGAAEYKTRIPDTEFPSSRQHVKTFENILNDKLKTKGWSPDDVGRIRSWGRMMLTLRERMGDKASNSFFDDLLKGLDPNFNRNQYDTFRRLLRSQVLDYIDSLPLKNQKMALRDFLDTIPFSRNKSGGIQRDTASQGKFFSGFRERLVNKMPGMDSIPDRKVTFEDGRMADGVVKVEAELIGENAPPVGTYIAEDKAGKAAFKEIQAAAYSDDLNNGNLVADGYTYDGILYFFQSETTARKAVAKLDAIDANSSIYVSYVSGNGNMRWLSRSDSGASAATVPDLDLD